MISEETFRTKCILVIFTEMEHLYIIMHFNNKRTSGVKFSNADFKLVYNCDYEKFKKLYKGLTLIKNKCIILDDYISVSDFKEKYPEYIL